MGNQIMRGKNCRVNEKLLMFWMCNLRHVQENGYSDRKLEKTQT